MMDGKHTAVEVKMFRHISDKFNIHWSVHRQYILRIQPTRCNVSQFIYFCKTLYKSKRMRWVGHVARMGEERWCIGSW